MGKLCAQLILLAVDCRGIVVLLQLVFPVSLFWKKTDSVHEFWRRLLIDTSLLLAQTVSCCEGSDEPSESCSDNAACAVLGLTGACCPTAEGNYLDCCSGSSQANVAPQCSAHAACTGLSGECCPTQDGVFLECCYSDAALPVAACDAYPACQAAGLTGLCCATAEGVYLECCDGLAQQATQCSAHGACGGLLGECCPTKDGIFLECCNADVPQTRECSANSACAAQSLEGNCCPPDFGSRNVSFRERNRL